VKRFLLLLALLAVTSGCSTRAVYDNFECLKNANKSYEEYERERKELLEIDSTNV
jgi:uncharacterized protein YceK